MRLVISRREHGLKPEEGPRKGEKEMEESSPDPRDPLPPGATVVYTVVVALIVVLAGLGIVLLLE